MRPSQANWLQGAGQERAARERSHTIHLDPSAARAAARRHRPQQSSRSLTPLLADAPSSGASGQQQRSQAAQAANQRTRIVYWNYKQTGIKSRPIKLLKHPIEHIERKIILTYLLGFLFKLIAILTGPLVVLFVYLLSVPFVLARRSVWYILNSRFTFDARIRTADEREHKPYPSAAKLAHVDSCSGQATSGRQWSDEEKQPDEPGESEKSALDSKQIYWNYCPLSFSESYWFREKLVNNVILAVESKEFSLDKLKRLVRERILDQAAYRKFLARVVARGLPLYKAHYWHYLGLQTDEPDEAETGPRCERDHDKDKASENHSTGRSSSGISLCFNTSVDQFSVTSIAAAGGQNVRIDIRPAAECGGTSAPADSGSGASERKVRLDDHIYLDQQLSVEQRRPEQAAANARRAAVCSYAYRLLDVPLQADRPLWELRVIPVVTAGQREPAASTPTSWFIIFRCHQCLADGRSLSNILTDHLTVPGCPGDLAAGAAAPNPSHQEMPINGPAEEPASEEQASGSAAALGTSSELYYDQDEDDATASGKLYGDTEEERELRPIKARRSFVARVSHSASLRSAIFVGPLTVLLWTIWSFTRRKNNHLNSRAETDDDSRGGEREAAGTIKNRFADQRRLYMTHYSLTKFHQIKQMTRSTVSDVILCALSGALRDYLRKFNGVSNPPNLNASLLVDMRQRDPVSSLEASPSRLIQVEQERSCCSSHHHHHHHHRHHSAPGALSNNSNDNNNKNSTSAVSLSSSSSTSSTKSGQLERSESEDLKAHKIVTPHGHMEEKPLVTNSEPVQVNCTLVNVPLPTSVEGTVPRLWDIRNTMDELRTSADPWVMQGLQRFLFTFLPVAWYQRLINCVALRNSSAFVSSLRGPQNLVEGWCVDLLQRALFEAQQSNTRLAAQVQARAHSFSPSSAKEAGRDRSGGGNKPPEGSISLAPANHNQVDAAKWRRKQRDKATRLRFIDPHLGYISAIYYCMQPPTSKIPLSFNCITYHDKLFVTALSRSLLVEDSKLLIRLFFKQLDQLANTIAKRRNLVTIIRAPVPIEISCQPPSPISVEPISALEADYEEGGHVEGTERAEMACVSPPQSALIRFEHESRSPASALLDMSSSGAHFVRGTLSQGGLGTPGGAKETASAARSSPQLALAPFTGAYRGRDDIEAGIGIYERTNICKTCLQAPCSCRRRKSLFSYELSKHRPNYLSNLLHPISKRTNVTNTFAPATNKGRVFQLPSSASGSPETEASGLDSQNLGQSSATNECFCGQKLLEELDEEDSGGLINSDDATGKNSSSGSAAGATSQRLSPRPCCPKCRAISQRSTLSLDMAAIRSGDGGTRQDQAERWSNHEADSSPQQKVLKDSSLSIDRKQIGCLDHLTPNQNGGFQTKLHSKSETDLLPPQRSHGKGGLRNLKESWFLMGRKSNRKMSLFSHSPVSNQQQISSRTSETRITSSNSKSRALFETPVELLQKRFGGDASKRRRRSLATSTSGASNAQHHTIVVKDEINADVSLRCGQLDGPFLGVRNRRFSAIGGPVVGTQRRASLIPFGLMQNNSFPKLFWDDSEAHL